MRSRKFSAAMKRGSTKAAPSSQSPMRMRRPWLGSCLISRIRRSSRLWTRREVVGWSSHIRRASSVRERGPVFRISRSIQI